jgi:phospholipase/carboxylesterase
MLQTIEINPKYPPNATIIWLHGLGADGNDFVNIWRLLNLPSELRVRFVLPHAPFRKVTYAGNIEIRAWFDITNFECNSPVDESGIRESQELIDALITRELVQKPHDYKIILAGFSQGGVMALQCGLRYQRELTGILALSSWLVLRHTLQKEKTSINRLTPILMLHGIRDELIPISLAKSSFTYLKMSGYNVKLLPFSVKHTVCIEEITEIGNWLRNLLL